MKQIIFRPEIERFDTCREFVREFCLDEQDLILTNEFIYRPYFGELSIKATVVFQEQYGAGEPSDEMVESILRDADLSCFRRVIGIGGPPSGACSDSHDLRDGERGHKHRRICPYPSGGKDGAGVRQHVRIVRSDDSRIAERPSVFGVCIGFH